MKNQTHKRFHFDLGFVQISFIMFVILLPPFLSDGLHHFDGPTGTRIWTVLC